MAVERRKLDVRHARRGRRDAENLLAKGYDKAGNWDLAQVRGHLAEWMRFPIEGFPKPPLLHPADVLADAGDGRARRCSRRFSPTDSRRAGGRCPQTVSALRWRRGGGGREAAGRPSSGWKAHTGEVHPVAAVRRDDQGRRRSQLQLKHCGASPEFSGAQEQISRDRHAERGTSATEKTWFPPKQKAGKIVQIIGSTFDVEFEEGHLPDIYNALKINGEDRGRDRHQPHRRGAAAPRRQPRAVRRARAAPTASSAAWRPIDTGGAGVGAGRPGNARPRVQPARRADRRPRAGQDQGDGVPSTASRRSSRPVAEVRGARHRHQGHRPADAARPRRQGRPVRRGRAGQDGHPHRTHQPHREGLQGLLGVRRRRRADPRGERPLAGNAGDEDQRRGRRQERARELRDGVRPDERAARCSPPRRAVGADDGRVVPRRDRHRDAALRR